MRSPYEESLNGNLLGCTIFRRPLDYPRHFVVRFWIVGPNHNYRYPYTIPDQQQPKIAHSQYACLCDSLEEARASIPFGMIRQDPEPGDDWAILEVWI